MQGWIWYTFGVPVTFVLPKTDLRPIVTLGWNFNSQCWCRGVGGFNGDGEANSRTLRRRPCCPRMLLPSRTACPWYAAATTAGTRRRVMEAALQNPHAIVQFSTDGVVSLEPLSLDIGEGLGQWEAKRVAPGTPMVFLQSGLYTYRTEDEKLPTVKTRGMKRNYQTQEEWLLQLVPAAWCKPADPNDPSTWPKLEIEQTEFVTAGSAVAGRKRFETIGRWAKKPRTIDVHIPGLKRRLNALRPELYYGTDERPARRCFELVETLPAQNTVENAYNVPSKPARPKWLETGEIAFTNEFAAEEDEETGRIIEAM